MSNDWPLIARTLSHTGVALLMSYFTWLIVRGQWIQDTLQKEDPHA